MLKDTFARAEAAKTRVVGEAARPVRHARDSESELANLVADAIREKVGADVALVNPGGLRSPLDAGPITYERVFQAIPFESSVSRLRVTGRELRDILRVAQCGVRGFFGVSGARLKLIDVRFSAPSTDLDGDGRIAHWEINRLLDARLADGSRIRNERIYTLATVDFLVQGGDDMAWAMSRVPQSRVELDAGGLLRDAVIEHLSRTGPVNTLDRPLVDPANPRLNFRRSSTPSQDWNEGRI
jgi:5'-nucleotidase